MVGQTAGLTVSGRVEAEPGGRWRDTRGSASPFAALHATRVGNRYQLFGIFGFGIIGIAKKSVLSVSVLSVLGNFRYRYYRYQKYRYFRYQKLGIFGTEL